MATLKLALRVDANNPVVGDLFLTSLGQTRMCATLGEEVAQLLYTRFRMFQGEWFLDAAAGVPWFQRILGIKGAHSTVNNILRSVITTCPGVASLDAFTPTYSGRSLALSFRCTLTDGSPLSSADFGAFVLPMAA